MIPTATYRIQFGKSFGFDDAVAVAPYLAELGITHIYASPYLHCRPDSEHGYDVTDHNKLNFALGGEVAFRHMLQAFRKHGLKHILDYVPNHMGVGGSDNPIWLDVLEWGQESQYASWFDVDWNSRCDYFAGKVLVPFLANQYGAELEAGKLELKFDRDRGEFSVWLYDVHKLPICPLSYPDILRSDADELERLSDEFSALPDTRPNIRRRAMELKERLAQCIATNDAARSELASALRRFAGISGQLDSWKQLDSLIRDQHWRPAHFRVATDDINYRRFFNISDLAGIRMELPEVFAESHRLVFQLLKEGDLQGLRIDHIDGLYNPKEYLERLRQCAGTSFYLVVEKILANHETAPRDWPVHGTTGYEFCAQVTGLFIDAAAEPAFDDLYRQFTGEFQTFPSIVRDSKIKIMENEMASELEALSREAVRIARQNPRTTDFTQNILRRALKEVIAHFPVYRTYIDGSRKEESDERYIHWAVAQAARYEQELDPSVFEFLENLLTGRLVRQRHSGYSRHAVIRFAMKAQQFSGPVMAKGLEDTAFYRYNRLIALNEVGGSPENFGTALSQFHKENQQRSKFWPHSMLATSTHDSKHGEDARARLAALTLLPDEWTAAVADWRRLLRARRGDIQGAAPPFPNDEYLLFQNLIATWPAELTLPFPLVTGLLADYTARLQAAMTKSLREARLRSNWISPDADYENAVAEYVADALRPERSSKFLESFRTFQQRVAVMGVHNSLVQLLLKVTSPGLPDFYQGSELWNLNFADPDNRRQVTFPKLHEMLLRVRASLSSDRSEALADFLTAWHNGAIKLAVSNLLLKFRRDNHLLFETGSYEPLSTHQCFGLGVFSYLRKTEQSVCVIAASLDARLTAPNQQSGQISLGSEPSLCCWQDVITGNTVRAQDGSLNVSHLFKTLPIALLIPANS